MKIQRSSRAPRTLTRIAPRLLKRLLTLAATSDSDDSDQAVVTVPATDPSKQRPSLLAMLPPIAATFDQPGPMAELITDNVVHLARLHRPEAIFVPRYLSLPEPLEIITRPHHAAPVGVRLPPRVALQTANNPETALTSVATAGMTALTRPTRTTIFTSAACSSNV